MSKSKRRGYMAFTGENKHSYNMKEEEILYA
jgi:hypothetical protein